MAIVQCLEKPNGPLFQYGTIQIEGWAFSTTGEISRVIVKCNRKKFYANFGLDREDVGKCHSAFYERSSKAGYSLEIKLLPKQLKKKQVVEITIVSENEQLTLEPIIMYSNSTNMTQRNYGILAALRKTYHYLKAGNFPRSLSQLKLCVQKFFYLLTRKPTNTNGLAEEFNANAYDFWMCKHAVDERKLKFMQKEQESFAYRPLISIIMPAYNPDIELFTKAIQSVQKQLYPYWELIINDDCSADKSLRNVVTELADNDPRIKFHRMTKNSNISVATNVAASMASGDFLFLMDHDDLIANHALFAVVQELNKHRDLDIIYSDDDKISMSDERFDPQFKPDFSPELLLSFMYFSHIFVIRKTLFDKLGGCRVGFEGSQDFDLALRATEETQKICHIPDVLYHWRAAPTSTAVSTATKPKSVENGRRAVDEALQRRGIPAKAIIPDFAQKIGIGLFALKYASDIYPKISIVIPTKNHKDILKRCLDSIVQKTTYPNYEIVLVDNCSDDRETLDYYKILDCKIITCENVNNKFNFSRMVNYGVENCSGEIVVLLNNDTEVIVPSWLEDMLVYAQIPGVGAVGAKLLYPDNVVQHAGVVIKLFNGIAGHAFKLIPDWDGGYLSFANIARNYSAVTAACIMVKKDIYQQIGGFNEKDFSVSFNDVDFCLRMREHGYRIVYNPQAKLYHHEGKSRGVEQSGYFSDPREEYNMVANWKIDTNYQDPYYNQNLSLTDETFAVECRRVVPTCRKRLNVLLITHNLNYEGAPLMQLHIAAGLTDKFDFTVLSPGDGPLRAEYEAAGIPVLIKDIRPSEHFTSAKEMYSHLAEIEQLLTENIPDVIYTNTLETFWGALLGQRMQIPVIWGIHESVDYNNYFAAFSPDIADAAIQSFMKTTKVVYVADATANIFRPLDTLNFVTIKNGIDVDKIQAYIAEHDREALRAQMNISEDETVISIFGAVCFRKGQKIFAEAAKKLLDHRTEKLRFLIVGAKESTYLHELRKYISQNQLDDKIEIIPVCDDIYQYYLVSDYFVCASYEESSPQVILEAMVFGLPIVSTNVFGIPELVRNNVEALLVEPGDSDAIKAALGKLLDDADLSEGLKYNSTYRVKTKFTNEIMLRNYEQLIFEAFEEGPNRIFEKYVKNAKK